MPSKFYGRAAANIIPKLLNFEQKLFNDDPDLLEKGVMMLKPKHDIKTKA